MFCSPDQEFMHHQRWPSLAGTDDSSLDASTDTSTITTPAEGSVSCTPPLGGYGHESIFDSHPLVEDLSGISPLSLSAPAEDHAGMSARHPSAAAGVDKRNFHSIPVSMGYHQQQSLPASCACLKELSSQLSHTTALSRQLIGLDTALSRTDEALRLAEDISACASCRLDGGKVLLPTMALLSKAFGLARVSYYSHSHDSSTRPQQEQVLSPAVYFGEWELSDDEDMRMVRKVLMSRTVSRASSVVGALQLRTEEFAVAMECRFMDSGPLQRGIQRLVGALSELAMCVKGSGRG